MIQKLTFFGVLIMWSMTSFANKSIPSGSYVIDAAHSKIGFEIPHLVISSVEGHFSKFDGSITIDEKIEKSKANLNIETASIDTDNKDRDDHLRSTDFFDASKNPKVVFITKKVIGPIERLKLVGDLTLKGNTKEVTLDVKYLGDVKDPWGNNKIAFTATGKINRQDFGLTWSKVVEAGPVVGDEVTLEIKIQASQKAAKVK